ncbi:hypothetical protein PM082_000240 [Marasmius tenuissimus]|nr:hypothetical protein PM082_000240 [Marasmius tenuissimus]
MELTRISINKDTKTSIAGGQIGQVTGGAVNQTHNNAGRDLINMINATISAPYPSLWNPIIGVGDLTNSLSEESVSQESVRKR